MVSVTLEAELGWAAPRGTMLTFDDLLVMPDDGQRYELIDGVLAPMASPSARHSYLAMRLGRCLEDAAPRDLIVLHAPTGAIVDDHHWVEPDAFVVPRSALDEQYFRGIPRLAIDILSPSNRMYDLTTKFSRYQRAGIPSHWIIDPSELRLIAWELQDGRYVEIADVAADAEWTASSPFEVTIRPGALLD